MRLIAIAVYLFARNALAQVERVGIRFNKEKAADISRTKLPQLAKMNQHAFEITGMAIDLNRISNAVWLYDVMKVKDPKLIARR
jgi:hypothetical protein